jgi:predicted lipid-binding transport protein (Tim44 family)
MTDLHPHWHATGDEDAAPAAIPVTVNTGASSKVSIQAASRMPGAFVGILIFGVIGFTLAGGWQAIDMSWLALVGGATSSSASSTSILRRRTSIRLRIGLAVIHWMPS